MARRIQNVIPTRYILTLYASSLLFQSTAFTTKFLYNVRICRRYICCPMVQWCKHLPCLFPNHSGIISILYCDMMVGVTHRRNVFVLKTKCKGRFQGGCEKYQLLKDERFMLISRAQVNTKVYCLCQNKSIS